MTAHHETVQKFRPLADLVPAHWQSGFVTSDDGARLHYTRTGGDKPVLILLHGVQVDGLMWLTPCSHRTISLYFRTKTID